MQHIDNERNLDPASSRRRGKRPSRFRFFVAACLGLAVALGSTAPAWAFNHYIVLFDGSGSVKKQHQSSDNLWEGKFGDNAFMSRIVSRFVDKVFDEMPPEFPRFDLANGDIISFALFRTDAYNPSYRPADLFLTNRSLVDYMSRPPSAVYERFDGPNGESIELKDAFTGHSPLQAATKASLPFFAERILSYGKTHGRDAQPVENTVIIRITDGDYNTEATGADERNVISDTAATYRRKDGVAVSGADDGFAAHRALTQQVDRLFDFGMRQTDCAFPTHSIPDRWSRPLVCGPGVYEQVAGWGKGFLITYMTVSPKAPALGGLARTERTRVGLDTVYRIGSDGDQGQVRLIGHNPIFANAFEDPEQRFRYVPHDPMWRRDGGAWQFCDEPNMASGTVNCGLGGPALDFAVGDAPETLVYRIEFLMDFMQSPTVPLLYPYTWDLGAKELPTVQVAVRPIEDEVVDIGDDALSAGGWFDLGLAAGGEAPVYEKRKIDPETFAEFVARWRDRLIARATEHTDDLGAILIRPLMLSQLSQELQLEARDRFNDRALHATLVAWAAGLAAVLIPLLYWLQWPRRRLELHPRNQAADGLVVDFNDRSHERPELVAMIDILNGRSNPLHRVPFKRLEARLAWDRLIPISGVSIDKLRLNQRPDGAAPLALGGPGTNAYNEKEVAHGKELLLFFDPREIADLDQPAGPEDAELAIPARVDVSARGGQAASIEETLKVRIIPEVGKLEHRCEGVVSDPDGKRHRAVEFSRGARDVLLCTYTLESTAKHKYSKPVKGELAVEVRDASGRAVEGAALLRIHDGLATTVEFYLRHAAPIKVEVLLYFAHLLDVNPVERESYTVVLSRRELLDDDTENPDPENGDSEAIDLVARAHPWLSFDQWRLDVERSTDETDVSTEVVENERHRSAALNVARPTLAETFLVGAGKRRRPVMPHAPQGQDFAALFKLRLANACRNGNGHAEWRASIEIIEREGIDFPDAALTLVDDYARPMTSGRLEDSPDSALRELDLSARLELRDSTILRRDHAITVDVRVDWAVYKRALKDPGRVERFQTRARVQCLLRHEPPKDVLAIDFGTSAMAIAHAAGPGGVRLLRLSDSLKNLPGRRRQDDPDEQDVYFISSEFNVCLEQQRLAELRPQDPEFIDLPLRINAIDTPERCFSSLKALMSQGFMTLPWLPEWFPYQAGDGGLETKKAPPLDSVIEGAYRGLVEHFVEPLLEARNQGYSHIYITHPNTYTQNHVVRLRQLVEEVFHGVARDANIVYPDNIHFVSESDAVAFYYLLHSEDLRADNMAVPERERILVYDIGAGTLDLSFLEVDWRRNTSGDYQPRHIRVLRRGGVTKAGDLLDECIARDLHEYLAAELDAERYLLPIVVDNDAAMNTQEIRRMDVLRQQIHKLKAELGAGAENPSLDLVYEASGVAELLLTKGNQTPQLYEGCSQLRATEKGEVFWEPGREVLLGGNYVSAFIERVTRDEVDSFFADDLPRPDTVILSGRTSLWPGFRERLEKTLGDIPNWVTFNANADELKRVVVMGVLQREFYWDNIKIEQPKQPGVFGVYYERVPNKWVFTAYPNSGERKEFNLQGASEVRIGLKTNNGFHVCHSLLPRDYCSDDRKLYIQLDYGDDDYLGVRVTNSDGDGRTIGEHTSIPTLSYRRRPWPLGGDKLKSMAPGKLLGDLEENAR